MKWINSTAFRIWIITNILILAGVTSLSTTYFWKQKAHFEQSLRNEGQTAANTLTSAIALSMLEEDYASITPMVYSLLDQPNIQYVIVRDTNGTIVNQKGETLKEDPILIEKVPLEYFNANLGEVEIALKTDDLNKQLSSLINSTLLISLLISIVAMIVTTIVSRQLSSPLVTLMNASQSLIDGNRKVEVVEVGTNETKSLSNVFNKMAQKIASNEEHLISEINNATYSLSEKINMLETSGNIARSVIKKDINREEVLLVILNEIRDFIHVDKISISVLNNQGKNDFNTYILNNNGIIKTSVAPFENTPCHLVILEKTNFIKNQIDTADLFLKERIFFNKDIQSTMMIPLVGKDKVIGSLNLGSFTKNFFDEKISEDLSVFTNQIVISLDLVTAYESLQKSAYHDFITELPNYRYFKEHLVKAIKNKEGASKSSQLAVLFLDLDRFKKINDSLGHDFGDILLKVIGKQVISCVSEDATVARIGGDEFLVLLPNIEDGHVAIETAKTINNKINQPITINGFEVHITSSIGIALYPSDGEDADTLVKHADIALFRLKEFGNNYSVYSPIVKDPSYDQLVFENDLRKALERNEFTVYYQPKINIQTGAITGLEALIRWKHPEKGLIFPGAFIPVAEETGLIVPIGEFILRKACQQLAEWNQAGMENLSISVNLSTKQFLQSNLIRMVESILHETGLEPHLLELEITESMTMDVKQATKILNHLKALGIKVSIDDFGTGYSSLNYLRMLPIDRLKIDRSFIKDITENPDNAAIVSTIINIANNLNLLVIAEGVEEESQVAILQGNNCDEIQGYYFSKPLPAEEFESKYNEIQQQAKKWTRVS